MLAPCGNRRAAVCPACSDRYAADAYHLLRAGLAGDDTKDVPDTVAEHPRVFLTLTAPSFGPVHTRTVTRRGHVIPCRCGDRHHPDDPRIGTAARPRHLRLRRRGAVAGPRRRAVGPVHHHPAPRPRRRPRRPRPRRSREHARLSYAKVAEYQRRGLVHFHAVIRLDGPDGPADPPPAGLDPRTRCATAITTAARAATLTTDRPGRDTARAAAGAPSSTCARSPRPRAGQLEDDDGEITDAALAGYIAKYATKTTGATRGRRPARSATAPTSPTSTSPRTTAA